MVKLILGTAALTVGAATKFLSQITHLLPLVTWGTALCHSHPGTETNRAGFLGNGPGRPDDRHDVGYGG